jgi:hypothetical protein
VSKVYENGKKITEVEYKCNKMQEIDSLKRTQNISEQVKLMNNLDISGIPNTTNESLFDILVKFSSKYQLKRIRWE